MPLKLHQALLGSCTWDNQPHQVLACLEIPKPWQGWVPVLPQELSSCS